MRAGDTQTHVFRVNLETGEAGRIARIGQSGRIRGMAIGA